MRYRFSLIVGSLVLVCVIGPAQTPGQEEMEVAQIEELRLTLSDCVHLALDQNTLIVQGKYTRDLEDTGIDFARNAFLPRLSTSWRISRTISGPREGQFLDPSTGLLTTTVGESRTSGNQNVSGSMSMSVFDASDFARLSASKNGYRASCRSISPQFDPAELVRSTENSGKDKYACWG